MFMTQFLFFLLFYTILWLNLKYHCLTKNLTSCISYSYYVFTTNTCIFYCFRNTTIGLNTENQVWIEFIQKAVDHNFNNTIQLIDT